VNFIRKNELLTFASKRFALAWLREHEFSALRGAAQGTGGGWISEDRQARWIPVPDKKPAGFLTVAVRPEVDNG